MIRPETFTNDGYVSRASSPIYESLANWL